VEAAQANQIRQQGLLVEHTLETAVEMAGVVEREINAPARYGEPVAAQVGTRALEVLEAMRGAMLEQQAQVAVAVAGTGKTVMYSARQ
jgi:hypothetical protein